MSERAFISCYFTRDNVRYQRLILRDKKCDSYTIQSRILLHTGLELISRFDVSQATTILLHRLYQDAIPVIPSKRPKAERDAMIHQRYEAGETMAELAKTYGISEQRVHQIIHYKK